MRLFIIIQKLMTLLASKRAHFLMLFIALTVLGDCSSSTPDTNETTQPVEGISCNSSVPGTLPTFVGDKDKDPELIVTSKGADGDIKAISEGDTIELAGGFSQGGVSTLVMVGARIKNMDVCSMKLEVSIKDEVSEQVRLDIRNVNLNKLVEGYGASIDNSTFANIPVCPNQWSSQNFYDVPYLVSIKLTDDDGRTVSTSFHVIPTCVVTIDQCKCICKQGYVLGEECS